MGKIILGSGSEKSVHAADQPDVGRRLGELACRASTYLKPLYDGTQHEPRLAGWRQFAADELPTHLDRGGTEEFLIELRQAERALRSYLLSRCSSTIPSTFSHLRNARSSKRRCKSSGRADLTPSEIEQAATLSPEEHAILDEELPHTGRAWEITPSTDFEELMRASPEKVREMEALEQSMPKPPRGVSLRVPARSRELRSSPLPGVTLGRRQESHSAP